MFAICKNEKPLISEVFVYVWTWSKRVVWTELCSHIRLASFNLLPHNKAQWLSQGKVLQRVCELHNEIPEFLRDDSDNAELFADSLFAESQPTLQTNSTHSAASTSLYKEVTFLSSRWVTESQHSWRYLSYVKKWYKIEPWICFPSFQVFLMKITCHWIQCQLATIH